MESRATKHLASKTPLGNYAPFTDLLISSGHDPASVSNYRRQLDSRTGLGTVSYSIGEANYTREFFCSHPNDVVAVRYTSTTPTLNLTVKTSTKHEGAKVKSSIGDNGNRIVLNGEAKMIQDNNRFMQIVDVSSSDGSVAAGSDGAIEVANASHDHPGRLLRLRSGLSVVQRTRFQIRL